MYNKIHEMYVNLIATLLICVGSCIFLITLLLRNINIFIILAPIGVLLIAIGSVAVNYATTIATEIDSRKHKNQTKW